MGQDQVSWGVRVLCWLAASVAMFYGNLQNSVISSKLAIKSSSVISSNRDCSRIELPCLSIDRNQFGRAKIRSNLHTFCNHLTVIMIIITTLFQTYLLISNQLYKLSISYLFCAQTNEVESIWKLFRQFSGEKNDEKYQFWIWVDFK